MESEKSKEIKKLKDISKSTENEEMKSDIEKRISGKTRNNNTIRK